MPKILSILSILPNHVGLTIAKALVQLKARAIDRMQFTLRRAPVGSLLYEES